MQHDSVGSAGQARPADTSLGDPQISAILTAVEQQLTKYFGAMAARAEAVQQAGEAGRAELVNHFQQQIDILRGEVERNRAAGVNFERALQSAIEERLTEFAANQQWRYTDLESRVERVAMDMTTNLPGHVEAAAAGLHQRLDRTADQLAQRIDELRTAAQRFDEQSAALVRHLNDTTASLGNRIEEIDSTFTRSLDDRTLSLSHRVDDAVAGLRSHVNEQVGQFTRRIDEADSRIVDRLLAMEERINEQTGSRLAALEATVGRISSGFDDAIVALSHRVIELENTHQILASRVEEMSAAIEQVDQEAIEQLREQMSSAVGESMLVRIELERVANSTGEQFDKIQVRIAELAAQIAENELDVSTAVQLERLEEIERALAELNPDQFVRKPTSAPPFGAPTLPAATTDASETAESDMSSDMSTW
jgi:hypothetical protein